MYDAAITICFREQLERHVEEHVEQSPGFNQTGH